jgi:hypothetical protein
VNAALEVAQTGEDPLSQALGRSGSPTPPPDQGHRPLGGLEVLRADGTHRHVLLEVDVQLLPYLVVEDQEYDLPGAFTVHLNEP